MSEPHADHTGPASAERSAERIEYPTNHLVAIVDTTEQVEPLIEALTTGGFLESEVDVGAGGELADAVGSTTGRKGWSDLAMRFAGQLGLPNDEMIVKHRYEQALRDGHFVVTVLAPSDERKNAAARILADHGARFINYLGRFSIELIRS
jgi:hypothetical protein